MYNGNIGIPVILNYEYPPTVIRASAKFWYLVFIESEFNSAPCEELVGWN